MADPGSTQSINTQNYETIFHIAVALGTPPSKFDFDLRSGVGAYRFSVEKAAQFFKSSLGGVLAQSSTGASALRAVSSVPSNGHPWQSVTKPTHAGTVSSDSQDSKSNSVMSARNLVFDAMDMINSFVARAQSAGFSPPDNPFSVIASLANSNGNPVADLDAKLANDLVFNLNVYIEFLKAEKEGVIDLEKHAFHASQLSSINFFFDGLGGSGDPLADLMRLLPDADAVKEQRAAAALAVLDFKKRVPHVIFSANYEPDGVLKGCVVGWKKIPDASGYIVRRRSIFDGREVSYLLTNSDIIARTEHVKDYVRAWILSFYDNINPSSVYSFLDGDVSPDSYYLYDIQAYQLKSSGKATIFSVDFAPGIMSQAQRIDVMQQLKVIDPSAGGNAVSPYPVLARQLLGNDKYDWLLAGLNVRTSITNKELRSTTRKYAYQSAQIDFLFSQMDAGKFFVPKGGKVDSIIKNVNDSISRFGIVQVIQEILQETGVLYYFEGKDAKEDTHFDRAGTPSPQNSDLIALVVSAIDPETAVIDLRSLATNLPRLLNGQGTTLDAGAQSSSPAEIAVPNNVENVNDLNSEDEIQFLDSMSLDDGHADLTTFEGIGKLMRTIRIISDFGPNRGAPIVATAPPVPVDPVPDPDPQDETEKPLPVNSGGQIEAQREEEKNASDADKSDKIDTKTGRTTQSGESTDTTKAKTITKKEDT